jgi:hypothetical protein
MRAAVEIEYSAKDPDSGEIRTEILSTIIGENLALVLVHLREDGEDLRL